MSYTPMNRQGGYFRCSKRNSAIVLKAIVDDLNTYLNIKIEEPSPFLDTYHGGKSMFTAIYSYEDGVELSKRKQKIVNQDYLFSPEYSAFKSSFTLIESHQLEKKDIKGVTKKKSEQIMEALVNEQLPSQ
jgi:hypothetical protein